MASTATACAASEAKLGHARLEITPVTAVFDGGGPVGDETGRLDPRGDVCERGGRLRERARGAHRLVQAGLGHPHRAGRDIDPPGLEPGHDLLEAAALHAADQVRGRAGETVEDQLRGVHALVAELGDGLDHLEARGALLDDEAGHAAVPGRLGGIGQSEQREGIALAAVGHEHLGAGQQVAVALAAGHRADRLHVRAGVGLGEAQAAAGLPAREAREQAEPLLLGAVLEHDERGHGVAVDHAGEGHEAPAELLDDPGVGRDVEAEAAVGGGHEGPEKAEALHAVHQLVRIPVRVLEGRGRGHHVPLHELADGGHEGGGAAGGAWTQGNLASRLAKPAHSLQGLPPARPAASSWSRLPGPVC